ncbi:adenylate/guanylate cyclase domain-containing protein [Caenimonas sedimenti]|uniref:Adenylate/guanylate cyclase domain-containing protein n=1 Tax=Caenimonas sedimenti TaxID=2596921 RepID=A0A562ZGF2_9BURK|nr:adenylate/guanylate cyclase domain-containing protein [Caenimonas sedimenti]TWO66680.1 adenylate/guanylate cyclase domain-containing protein [Caenimonas sedimenti]
MRATASSWRRAAAVPAAGLLAVALVFALSYSRTWDAVEGKIFDLFTSWAAPGVSRQPIVILAIDEPTFQELRVQWPFPRSLHGKVLERARADGAAAVGFDIVFAEPSQPEQDHAFARSIATAGRVVLASTQELIVHANASLWTQVPPLPELLAAGAVAGDISVRPDDDYVVRRQSNAEGSLSEQLARLAPTPPAPRSAVPALIQYLGPRGTIDTRSYYQALEPGLLPPGFFRGKLVLVGRSTRSATELQASRSDMYNSPLAVANSGDRLFPGVEIQATMLENRLSGGGLHQLGAGWGYALLAAFGSLLFVAGRRLDPGATALLALACVLVVLVASYALFFGAQRWLPPLFPVAALVALYGATTVASYLATRQRALRVRGMFAQYVPAPVVARLVEQPELLRLGGESREVTLMFTDLANFTGLSERLSAQQTVEVLTAYFNAMTPIVHKYQGTLDKFIGDAIMAFWGAPLDDAQHAEHAVRAAIEMQQAMQQLVADLQARGLPAIGMRIGIHTGTAVIGNVGSASRFSYTAIGDAVNLAARLEGANKAFGTGILLSQATAAQLPADIGLRALADVIVKGKTEPVRVYTPCDDEAQRHASETALQGVSPVALEKL